MLNTALVHPDILRILAQAGHHSKVLIADGNYPASNKRGPRAELVSLQLSPGIPTVAQVLEAILGTVRIDGVNTMGIDRTDPYAAAAAGAQCELEPILKWDFYEAVASVDHVLTIQTAEQAPWANLLLTVGCRTFS